MKEVIRIGTGLAVLLMVTACEIPTESTESGGPIVFDVTNASPAPLRNVTIGGVEVGDFPNSTGDDRVTIEGIELPESGEYEVSAEIDTTSGEVLSYTYTTSFSDGSQKYLSLPSDYVAIRARDNAGSTNLEYRFRYGSIDFGFFPADSEEFLGVYDYVDGQDGTTELWFNGTKQSEYSVTPVPTGWGIELEFYS